MILISSHKEVRDALVENDLSFILVYPSRDIKDEYIKRYVDRGNNESFVDLLNKNWDNWLSELETQEGCVKIELKEGQYLSDVI